MLGKAFNNSISKNKKIEEKPENNIGFFDNIKTKLETFFHLGKSKVQETKDEIFEMKEKLGNLLETNYKLGLTHLENGNLSDAVFRFRFIIKFWPHHLDSYYQLAYCLVLKNKFLQAKKVLEELLVKDPNYDQKAQDLLNRINHFEQQQESSDV